MDTFVSDLTQRFPALKYEQGDTFYWSPSEGVVHYRSPREDADLWSLLHETSHGLLKHRDFSSDFELLSLEVAAWTKATQLARELGCEPIDQDYVEDCLDTYRDWLHKRCKCPSCGLEALQADERTYQCLNCLSVWSVTQNRHCRHYRTRLDSPKSAHNNQ